MSPAISPEPAWTLERYSLVGTVTGDHECAGELQKAGAGLVEGHRSSSSRRVHHASEFLPRRYRSGRTPLAAAQDDFAVSILAGAPKLLLGFPLTTLLSEATLSCRPPLQFAGVRCCCL